jgi:hypothetical protein
LLIGKGGGRGIIPLIRKGFRGETGDIHSERQGGYGVEDKMLSRNVKREFSLMGGEAKA